MKTRSIKMYGPNRRLHGREDLYVFSLVVYYSITKLLILLLLLARPAHDTNKCENVKNVTRAKIVIKGD